jgi:hypothetical protein
MATTRRRKAGYRAALIGVVVVGIMATECTGGDSYKEFLSAVQSGAPCSELFDQRGNFTNQRDLERIDSTLDEIGCEDSTSERTDG